MSSIGQSLRISIPNLGLVARPSPQILVLTRELCLLFQKNSEFLIKSSTCKTFFTARTKYDTDKRTWNSLSVIQNIFECQIPDWSNDFIIYFQICTWFVAHWRSDSGIKHDTVYRRILLTSLLRMNGSFFSLFLTFQRRKLLESIRDNLYL